MEIGYLVVDYQNWVMYNTIYTIERLVEKQKIKYSQNKCPTDSTQNRKFILE